MKRETGKSLSLRPRELKLYVVMAFQPLKKYWNKVFGTFSPDSDLMHSTKSLFSLVSGFSILFRSQDMSELKAYLQDQWMSILSGRVSEQDFILAQEVRLGEYR